MPTPSEDMGEIKDDNPSRKLVEEKAADKLDDKLQFQATEMEAAAYALAAQHVADIARSTEALLTLGQTLPTALRQHSEAMSRFTESVPQLLARMASSEQLTSTTEGS